MMKDHPDYTLLDTQSQSLSHVQTLWHTLLLLVEHLLLGLAEVGLCDPHAPLAQGQKTGLGADSLEVWDKNSVNPRYRSAPSAVITHTVKQW